MTFICNFNKKIFNDSDNTKIIPVKIPEVVKGQVLQRLQQLLQDDPNFKHKKNRES